MNTSKPRHRADCANISLTGICSRGQDPRGHAGSGEGRREGRGDVLLLHHWGDAAARRPPGRCGCPGTSSGAAGPLRPLMWLTPRFFQNSSSTPSPTDSLLFGENDYRSPNHAQRTFVWRFWSVWGSVGWRRRRFLFFQSFYLSQRYTILFEAKLFRVIVMKFNKSSVI